MTTKWRVDDAVRHLIDHAQPASTSDCARFTRQAIAAGGVNLTNTNSAKDYGPSLVGAGFVGLNYCPARYLPGDVVVIQAIARHPHGHMAMYDGSRWVSDFIQRSMYPGSAYGRDQPEYVVYRHPDAVETSR